MADKFPTIFIPEQNDFIYCLTFTDVQLSAVTNLQVFASLDPSKTMELGFTFSGNKLKIPFRNLKQGEYNLWVTFISGGQRVSYNYKAAFRIVPWNNRYINWEDYKEGNTLSVAAGVCLIVSFTEGDWATLWNTIEQLESLKDNCESAAEEAHEAADYAKQEGDYAKAQGQNAQTIYTQVKNAYDSGQLKGETGATGAQGPAGKDGKDGEDGKDGTFSYPSFAINSSGHLIASVPETAADMEIQINNNGHLIITI